MPTERLNERDAHLERDLEAILMRLDQARLWRAGAYVSMAVHCLNRRGDGSSRSS